MPFIISCPFCRFKLYALFNHGKNEAALYSMYICMTLFASIFSIIFLLDFKTALTVVFKFFLFDYYIFSLSRLSLLAEWHGVRDEALSELSGIPGCVFVHASGFIGGNKTFDGAMEMARKTLKKRDLKSS